MANKLNIDPSEFQNLTRQIADAIASGMQQGAKKGGQSFGGGDLIKEMRAQLNELNQQEKVRDFATKVRKQFLNENLSPQRLEIQIVKQQQLERNNLVKTAAEQNIIELGILKLHAQQAGNQALVDLYDKKIAKSQKFIESVEQENAEIEGTAKALDKKLAQQEREDEFNSKQREVGEKLKEINHKLKERVGITQELIDQLRTPQLAGGVFAEQMAEKIGHVNHTMHELVDSGMQAGEAINLMREDFSIMSAVGLSKVSEVSKNLVENFGTAKVLTEEQRAAVGQMATSYGLAGDEAANLTMAISRMPGESKDTATNFAKTAENVGKMSGVLPSQIMKEMAKNSGLTATYSKGGAEGFAKAAASAKKMGVELGSVLSAAEKTLDFESSINSQMQASVLTGKQLNFDRLRSAALAGDSNAILQEQANIMKQVGSLDNMNLLQKKALAESLNMTVEELTKFNEAQKLENQYFGENSTMLDRVIGGVMKYGGATAGFVKENGLLILSFIQTLPLLGSMISGLASGAAALVTKTIALFSNTAAQTLNTSVTEASIPVTTASGQAAKGAATSMLALGGAILMIGAGIGLATMGIANLAEAIKGMNSDQMITLGAILAGIAVGIGILAATSFTAAPGLGALALAVMGVGAGLLMMGTGIGIAAAGMSLLVATLKEVPFENLLALPIAFMGIGAGLYMMATAGLAALPVIGALVGLAVAAPALAKLADSLGFSTAEGGAEQQEDGVKILADKIDQLIAVVSQGSTINMDGRKVGEVIALAMPVRGIK